LYEIAAGPGSRKSRSHATSVETSNRPLTRAAARCLMGP